MPAIYSVNFTRYTTTKLIEIIFLLIGFGLLHFAYDQDRDVTSMLIFHGGVLFMIIVVLFLFMGKIFKKEPSAGTCLVINMIGFIFFAVLGIFLLCRAEAKAQSSKRPGNIFFSSARRKTYIPQLLGGIFAIVNAICFMAENILIYLPRLYFLFVKKDQYVEHAARRRIAQAPTLSTIIEQDEEAEY